MELKDKLNQAFALLRKQGYIAKQNYKCCSSCAGYAIACDAVDLVAKGKKINGAVYYHRQDKESAWPPSTKWWMLNSSQQRTLMIRYGQIDTEQIGQVGKDTAAVAKDICAVFDQLGITYTWNGDVMSCIEVLVS